MSGGWVFVLGLLGGVVAEFLRWWRLRETPPADLPSFSWFYWAMTALMILAGGGLAYGYSTSTDVNWPLALNIGASALLILNALGASSPTIPPPS
jgi:hypothetical protein